MAVVVEIADQRHIEIHRQQLVPDPGDGLGGFVVIDGDPHNSDPARASWATLHRGRKIIGRIGVGHGLNDNWAARANHNLTNPHFTGDTPRGSPPGEKKIHGFCPHSSLRRATVALVPRLTGVPLRSSFT
jgi:hypothetical protein